MNKSAGLIRLWTLTTVTLTASQDGGSCRGRFDWSPRRPQTSQPTSSTATPNRRPRPPPATRGPPPRPSRSRGTRPPRLTSRWSPAYSTKMSRTRHRPRAHLPMSTSVWLSAPRASPSRCTPQSCPGSRKSRSISLWHVDSGRRRSCRKARRGCRSCRGLQRLYR